jgi:hypothetical protein
MQSNTILKIVAVLWVVWGLVHILAGVMTMSQDTVGAIAGIADAVDRDMLAGSYHEAVGAVINQHGFKLLWIGLTTTICAAFIWRGNHTAMFIAGLTGGLADVGYFLFLDLGGFVHFVPGTIMTLISVTAILLGLLVYARLKRSGKFEQRA